MAFPAAPVGAVFRSGEDSAVFRVDDGRASIAPIEIGRLTADWAGLQSGLEPGDAVILHARDLIADGFRVAVDP